MGKIKGNQNSDNPFLGSTCQQSSTYLGEQNETLLQDYETANQGSACALKLVPS